MSFDALAPHYRWMEFILAGEKLQRCRTAFLDEISAARNILLLGEGHGRCLLECCRRFANARISCLDASKPMLAQARRHLYRHGLGAAQVEYIHTDVLNWTSTAESYDLIVTNFFLDCFHAEQLEQIISQLAIATTPNASWLLADFQTPPAGLRRICSRFILWTMYAFFRTMARLSAHKLTMPEPILERAGFALFDRIEREWGLLHSDWWRR
jgi:ubiquinone/menaquinone biosynthesis C-methylase UbiE